MFVNLWFDEETESGVQHFLVKRRVVPLSDKPKNASQIRVDFDVSIDGRPSHSPKEAVEAILPVAANQFFMFHGEDLRAMSQRHVEHTQRAIELIIDAETFVQGKKDLDYVADRIEAELDEERARSGVANQLLEDKKEIQSNITKFKREMGAVNDQLGSLNKELGEIEGKLGQYTESEKLIIQLEEKKKQLNHFEEERQRLLEGKSRLVSGLPLRLLLPELKKALSVKEERHKAIEEKRRGIIELQARKKFIEGLLEEDLCVCERPLDSKERQLLKSKLVSLTKGIDDREAKIEKEDPTYYELRETITAIENSGLDYESFYAQLSKNALEIDEIKASVKKLEDTLGEINKEEIRQLSNRRSELKREMREKEDQIAVWRAKLNDQENFLDRTVRSIQVAESKMGLLSSLEQQLQLARSGANAFEEILSQLVEMRRVTIEREATDIFRRLTNKPDEYKSVKIDREYNISVIDFDGNEVQRETLSTGEREIVALSFVLGLMRASEKKAPLVLDTFFVHLDEAHYSNIVRALPEFASQILLILTDLEYKNLKERASTGFFDNVNKVWKVVRDSEREASAVVPWSEPVLVQ